MVNEMGRSERRGMITCIYCDTVVSPHGIGKEAFISHLIRTHYETVADVVNLIVDPETGHCYMCSTNVGGGDLGRMRFMKHVLTTHTDQFLVRW